MAFSPRILRVSDSDYFSDEPMESPDTHSDKRLSHLARIGYDGVWIHAELRELAPTALFAGFVKDAEKRRERLRLTARRARKHGIGIWLYLNEPRAYPQSHPFWDKHPECKGAPGKDNAIAWKRGSEWLKTYSMCLSAPRVREFLEEATCQLFTEIPELAGALVITAAEHSTHCYSHAYRKPGAKADCPRCADRSPLEMPVEVARAMKAGLDASKTNATVAIWTWAWNGYGPAPQPFILDRLPDVPLLSDFERGQPAELLGKKFLVDEYSLAIVGPSQQFLDYANAWKPSGREIWMKLQVTSTHELATVPNLPVPGILYQKIANAHDLGVKGAMGTWTMGDEYTLNASAAGKLLSHEGKFPSKDEFLRDLAAEYFEAPLAASDIDRLIAAWAKFEAAMQYYPSTMAFVYHGPINYAPAFPWRLKRQMTMTARSWTTDAWGDNLEYAAVPFTLAEIAKLLTLLSEEWDAGVALCEEALAPFAGDHPKVRAEWDTAAACGLFFRSCAHLHAFTDAVERQAPPDKLAALIHAEKALCERLVVIMERNPLIGWHGDARFHMVNPENVRAKMHGLDELLRELPRAETAAVG